MNVAVAPSSHWQISTRPTGEVLTARICADDVDLVVLGIPSGFTVAEVEGWMRDLLGVARETSRHDAGERPIPALLHHILTGLLFSHAELWDRAGGTLACSCVFLHVGNEVAFGWVGDRDPEVWIRGQRLDVEWVRVRDDEGREARAFAIDAQHPLEIKLVWPNELEIEAEGRSIELNARWPARVEAPGATDAAAPTPPNMTPQPGAPANVFSMAMLSSEGRAAADAAPGTPLDIEPRSSIAPESVNEVESPAWPPLREEPPLPEALPQDAPGLTFAPPALQPMPAAARAPEPVSAAPALQPTPVAAYEPPPAPAVAHDDAAWDLESGVEPATETGPPAWNVEPTVAVGPPAWVEQPEATPPQGNWSTVYEPEAGVLGPEAPVEPAPKKGMLGWISGLMRRKNTPAEPLLTYEESVAPREVAPPVMHAPPMAQPVAPREVAPPVMHAPRVAQPVAPRPSVQIPKLVPLAPPAPPVFEEAPQVPVAAPPPIGRVSVVAQFPPPAPLVVEPVAVAPQPPPKPRATPPAPVKAAMFTTSAPIEDLQNVAPAPVAPPRAATTVGRAVAASETTRDETDVPWMDEQPASPRAARVSRPPAYPVRTAEDYGATPLWKRPWVWGAALVALFVGGWLVGAMQDDGSHRNGPTLAQRVMRSVGLGGARFQVTVNSRPPGAWIAVDGKDMAKRTPATIDLAPGEHPVTLSFADLGAATYNVRGVRGDKVALDAALWGTLAVRGSDMSIPIAVSVDGKSLGFAPIMLDSMVPGAHEVRFSGPGMPSWSQTVTVRVGEPTDVLARPMTSPATGVIDVRASLAGDSGADGITGAAVYIDGLRRGSTPLTVELPRGPHSIRVEQQGETAPVQVIDLPGGNQRFANFEFGLDIERPTMSALAPPARIPLDKPAVISASLSGVGSSEVREMWLHVRTPDETWRRYQMVLMKATGGVVGVAVFPPTMFDSEGHARWYVSASTQTGDDYFTELQTSDLQAPAARR